MDIGYLNENHEPHPISALHIILVITVSFLFSCRSMSFERAGGGGPSGSSGRSKGSTSSAAAAAAAAAAARPVVTEADLEGKSPDEQEMMKAMGFCGFDTTKNKKVDGNDVGDVHVILKRKYRQYMNRKGGFNRPLDFVA